MRTTVAATWNGRRPACIRGQTTTNQLPRDEAQSVIMIIDLRIYTVKPGRVGDFVKMYHEHAWPLQVKYLDRCLGWYTGAEGQLNQIVQVWAYESQADRERRRTAMNQDPAWQAYLRRMGESGLLLHTENRFLTPTEFSPVPIPR
jgi:hypothetical protein